MPVQINEVIIKAVVEPPPISNGTQHAAIHDNVYDYEAIEKVLEIIKEKQER